MQKTQGLSKKLKFKDNSPAKQRSVKGGGKSIPPRSVPANRHTAAVDCSQSQASTKVHSSSNSEPTQAMLWLKEQLEEAWRREV